MSGRPNGEGGDEVWAAAFASLPPKTTLQILRTRLQKSQHFNDSLSDLFDKRAAIEMEYVEKLAKLGRKVEEKGVGPVGTGTGEGKSTGGEGKCWEMVLKELNETCGLHTSFSNSLSSDILPPIRDMHNKISLWNRVGVMDGNVDKVVKAWDSARTKVDKAQKKGGPKLTAAQSELSSLTSDLEIQTPTIYTAYQQLEAARLDRLKETLVKWETVRSDLGRGVLEGSERGMNVLLGWEVERDVEELARRLGGGTAGRSQAASMTPSSRRQTMSSDLPPASYAGSPARNGTSHDNGSLTNLPQNTSLTSTLKSKFGRKNSMMGGSPGGFLGNRDRSESNATMRSDGRIGTGAGAFETLAEPRGSTGEGYDTIRRPSERGRANTTASDVAGATGQANVDAEGFSVPPADRDQAPWERSEAAPRNLMDDDNDENDSVSALPPMSAAPSANSAGKYNLAMAPLPIQENEAERQAALAKVQSTLLAAPPSGGSTVGRRTTMRGRRDVRNTTFQAVPDDMPLAQALKLKGIQTDGMNQRSESPSAMVESPTSGVFPTGSALAAQATGISAFSANPFGVGMNRQASTMSTTSSAVSNNPFDGHPLPTAGPGLRASITETVNVLSRGGVVSRAMVTGEITLTLRDVSKIAAGGASPGAIHIRLDQFEQLEKVAPNPKYLAQVPDRPGEYFLNSEVLAQVTAAGGQQPVLFKYQLHVGEGRAQGFAPIEVNAQWKPMENETRLLLAYSAPEDSRLSGQVKALQGSEGKITDLTIIAGLGGAAVTSVQAKPPGGIWSPESRRMTWKGDDLAFGGSGKIAARFLMDGVGVPEGVTMRWRVEGCLSSGLGISVVEPTLDAETVGREGWRFEQVRKAVVSGKYVAEPA